MVGNMTIHKLIILTIKQKLQQYALNMENILLGLVTTFIKNVAVKNVVVDIKIILKNLLKKQKNYMVINMIIRKLNMMEIRKKYV